MEALPKRLETNVPGCEQLAVTCDQYAGSRLLRCEAYETGKASFSKEIAPPAAGFREELNFVADPSPSAQDRSSQ